MLFSLLMYTRIIIYGLVKTSVMALFSFWITSLFDLEINYRQTVGIPIGILLLLQICFYFIMKGNS